MFSLLILLKSKRAKSFPSILAVIEKLLEVNAGDEVLINSLIDSIKKIFYYKLSKIDENLYDLIWLAYFIKSNGLFKIIWPSLLKSELLNSLKVNNQKFFISEPDILLYCKLLKPGKNKSLLTHLAIFPKDS